MSAVRSVEDRASKLTAYQQAVVYQATELGLSHECTGKVFSVSSVPRIVRRVKKKLSNMSVARQKELLESWNIGCAHIDAIVEVSKKRAQGSIE